MINEIINYEKSPIRTRQMNGETWFVAKDVCDILGIEQVTNAIKSLDEDEVQLMDVSHTTAKGVNSSNPLLTKYDLSSTEAKNVQKTNMVNESGLYQLIFKSRKPEARKFVRWVTGEVLPMIRRYGFYSVDEKRVERAEVRLDKKAVRVLLRDMKKYIRLSDRSVVSRQLGVSCAYIEGVMNGRIEDVNVMQALTTRAIGNKEARAIFYSAEGANNIIEELRKKFES